MKNLTSCSTLFLVAVVSINRLMAQDPELTNGTFEKWKDGAPVGWTVEVGATNGRNEPKSAVEKGEGPSLQLSGTQRTLAWHLVAQTVNIESEKTYRLNYTAKATDIKREGRQFDNCYVGVFQLDQGGNIVARSVANQTAKEFEKQQLVFRTAQNATQAKVMIFLSKTGRLSVKGISMEVLDPKESFQMLVDDMDRHYSYFELKKIDWQRITQKYRVAAEEKLDEGDTDGFVDVITEMLAELEDLHVWVQHKGQRLSKYVSRYDGNFDFRHVRKQLREIKRFGRLGWTAITNDGFGYIQVSALTANNQQVQAMTEDIQGRLFATPGILLDLRKNGGGSEPQAAQIARLFADQERIYARSAFRSGPSHDQFVEAPPRRISPTDNSFTGPVACLIGPGAVSSAEGFAMMIKTQPHAKLFGKPTRGASGNPRSVSLPNGVEVYYSRWKSMLPDGTPIEGSGVLPDVEVEHAEGDPTYEKAVEWLENSGK